MKEVELEIRDFTVGNNALSDFENSRMSETLAWGHDKVQTKTYSNWEKEIETNLSAQTQPHIEATLELAETTCGIDDRKKVKSTDYPNRFICRLIITAKDGSRYVGSGFFVSPKCIITSGHCVHFSTDSDETFDWAASIEVIPGANGNTAPFGTQVSHVFRTVKGWAMDRKSNYDHGAVILPDDTMYKRVGGFFGCQELMDNQLLINTGYPADKSNDERGTPWTAQGLPAYNNDFKIAYMLDTAGGNSGSPVYTQINDEIKVVGVHGYGSCPNKCIKVRDGVLRKWNEWKKL